MPLPTPPANIFPFYLLPSIPFRRRSSAASTAPTLSSSPGSVSSPKTISSSPNTPPAPSYLPTNTSILRCTRCRTDICPTTSIISKGFTGRHGRAYLVSPPSSSGYSTPPTNLPRHHDPSNLPNTHTDRPVPRQLVTGAHMVSDITCVICGTVLGWKYVSAEEEAQKYKEGCFILETRRVMRSVDWDNEAPPAFSPVLSSSPSSFVTASSSSGFVDDGEHSQRRKDSGWSDYTDADDVVEFDSQDEDECEDLFMGIWSPGLAKRRRRARLLRGM
jgi:hypothetical protein